MGPPRSGDAQLGVAAAANAIAIAAIAASPAICVGCHPRGARPRIAARAAVAALPWPFGRALIKPAGAASGAAPAAGGVFLYGGITVGATVSGRLQVAGAGSHAPQLLPALQRSRALPPLDEAKAQFVAQHPEYGYK